MAFLLYAALALWYRLRPKPPLPPAPEPFADLLTNARRQHPEHFEALDFAAWEIQMEDQHE